MRKFAFIAPLGAVLAIAATPALAAEPTVTVTLGPDLQDKVEDLGAREVSQQTDRLVEVVQRTLARRGALDGARIDLVITDLKPNKPTWEQMSDRPGLDYFGSVSIGGAAFEGQVTLADGSVQPIKYDWFTNNLAEVYGYSTWQDAGRAYQRLASKLADGRYVTR